MKFYLMRIQGTPKYGAGLYSIPVELTDENAAGLREAGFILIEN